jgi:hypothetical protein
MARKKLKAAIAALLTRSSSLASGNKIPFSDADGLLKGQVSLADLQGILEKLRKDGAPRLGGSVFIATIEDNYYRFWLPEYFAASNAANAVGVMVKDGDNHIIIAKDEAPTTMNWSTSNVTGGTTNCGREAAMKDHDGRAKTTTVVNTLGDNGLVAKYCQNYYPSNMAENNQFFGKGRWWAPAAGDLWMMYQHFNEINYALSLINGTPLSRSAYWSITEHSPTIACYLYFTIGHFTSSDRSTTSYRVRPVSAFY